MKVCPQCASSFADDVATCARDGEVLLFAPPPAEASEPPPSEAGAPPPARDEALAGGPKAPGTDGQLALAATAPAPATAEAGGALAGSPSEGFDSLVGATLASRYLIIRRIGEGGMGAVYEARHTIIGKRVAVKVLLEKFLTKSDFVARLLQEARLASAIGHEHIVDVTDFGTTDDGRAFVVMEFLDGEALSQLVMREAPLPVERSLRLALQVAGALGAAHAKGIVHRDVKPENVYLIRRGDADFVKVVDFGISKAVKQGQGEDAPDYRLTHTGLLLGTPLYMSPEQARGEEDLDERVDVWALGVMLYECLTGEVPFRANNYLGIISQVLTHEAIPPSRLRPELGISEAVETVVMRAMEKDRSRRYPTMADVEADLQRLLGGEQNVGAGLGASPTTAPPTGNPGRGRVWVWGAAAAALIVGVAMALSRPEPRAGAASGPEESDRASASSPSDPRGPGAERLVPIEGAASPRPSAPRAASVGAPARGSGPVGALSARPASGGGVDERGARTTAGAARPGNRPARERVDRAVTNGLRRRTPGDATDDRRGLDEGATRKTTEDVLRGALPSRSGEGYPDPP